MKKVLRFLLPAIVIIVALLVMNKLISLRKAPAKQAPVETVTLVEFANVAPSDSQPLIQISGTVQPSRLVEIRAQVGGEIVELNPKLMPGGVFKKGEMLLKIDPRDYEFRVERTKAEVERARFELQSEKGRAAVAKEEWTLLGEGLETSPEGRELSLRIPHVRRAESALAAAISAMAEAQLNLERTTLTAPFNAQLRMESVEVGQVVSPQTLIAQLTGVDTYWVQASIQVEELSHINLPDAQGKGGSEAQVILVAGASEIRRQAHVLRLLGGLEQSGRMARLLLEVSDPMGLKSGEGGLPLLLDAFVRVEIVGKTFEQIYVVPAAAIHEGNLIWVVDPEDRLEIRPVEIAWRERDRVLLSKGLNAGDRLIESRISTPIHGMKLEPVPKQATTAASAEGKNLEH